MTKECKLVSTDINNGIIEKIISAVTYPHKKL